MDVKVAKSFGDVFLFRELAAGLGLEKMLSDEYPDDWKLLLCLAFSKLKGVESMRLVEPSVDDSFFGELYDTEIPSDQRISEILEAVPDKAPGFFRSWIAKHGGSALFYDITSLSSNSRSINMLEYGYNRDGDKLPQVNLGLVVNKNTNIPVYFKIFPGSLPDVSTLQGMIGDLKEFGLHDNLLVIDRGFYSRENLQRIHEAGMNFILPLPLTVNAAKKLLAEQAKQLKNPVNAQRFEKQLVFVTQKDITIDGLELHAHVIYDEARQNDQTNSFYDRLFDVEKKLDGATVYGPLDVFLEHNAKGFRNFFEWTLNDGILSCKRKPKAIKRRTNQFGKMILISSTQITWDKALLYYRQKDAIEKHYYSLKNFVEGAPLRVRKDKTLMGLMFVMFLTLIVRAAFLQRLANTKAKNTYLPDALLELSKIRAVKIGKNWKLTETTKRQRLVIDALKIQEPKLPPSY